jgi:hypothetical protein
MSLNSRYVQVGGRIRAGGHNAVVDDLNTLANPRMPVGGQPRWLFESNYGRQLVLYGTTSGDYTSGATISLTPCDANGVATGEAAVTVTIPTSWGTVNLASATIGGTATAVTCKIASGELLQYAFAGATPYLLGVKPTQIVSDPRYDASSHKYQVKVAWIFGTNSSTVSEWMDLLALSNQAIGHEVRYDTSTTAFQYRVVSAYLPEAPTQGAWTDLADIEESDTTPCI